MFYFVASLKPYNYHRGRGNRRFGCYLLSTDYAHEQQDTLRDLRLTDELLVADNGNFDVIGDLIEASLAEANVLTDARRQIERELDHYLRPGELGGDVRASFRQFAESISANCRTLVSEARTKAAVTAQSGMRPTYIVGMENLAIPVLTGLSIEPQYLGYPLDWYTQFTSEALQYALDTSAQQYGAVDATVFAGLHAFDFDTAFQAGRLAGQVGVNSVATGVGSALDDREWIDFRVAHGELIPFDEPIPRAYVRTMEIVCGLNLGFAAQTGRRLALHVLGVGTPILVTLVGLLGRRGTFSAVDSTSPVKDAFSSKTISLYVDTPAPRKLKAHKIIEYWLQDDLGWQCLCPYCRKIDRAYPPRVEAARSWWRSAGCPSIDAGDLYGDHPLTQCFPLLSNPSSDVLRLQVGHARIGHNHWLLQRLEKQARDYGETISRRCERVDSIVNAYLSAPGGSAEWSRAVAIAWDLTRQTAIALDRFDDGLTLQR